MSITFTLIVLLGMGAATDPPAVSDIKADETVVFFPTVGWPLPGGGWKCEVHGWIHEPGGEHRLLLAQFRKAVGLDDEEMTAREQSTLRRRARPFLVDNERGKRIVVRFGDADFALPASKPNGHFTGRVRLAARQVEALRKADLAPFQAVVDPSDRRSYAGEVHLLAETGLSVVSDIDDTIKITEVRDRKALVRNTFLRPFTAVPGMAETYQAWAKLPGAAFHYVSGSPWQLYAPLEEFRADAGFPAGSFHLRAFRLTDESGRDFFKAPRAHKLSAIDALIRAGPKRRFVLVGDSGESDPEIYGEAARLHGDRIARIFIRDITGDRADGPRYKKAFAELPPDRWKVFRDAYDLPRTLP